MSDYLLVDGHVRRMAAARDALVKTQTDYQDQTGIRVVLVFDGQGARATEEEPGRDGIQVFYAPAGRTADGLIERLVAKYAGTYRLTVATSDHLEQQTALTFGAAGCISAEGLRDVLAAAAREFDRRTKDYRRKTR